MKILITGAVKSGKSRYAEDRIIEMSNGLLPIYLATCELYDKEMEIRIQNHQKKRSKKFETIEESLYLYDIIKDRKNPVLIECMTMWLNNALHYNFTEKKILSEVDNLLKLQNDLIFVLNEVGMGIIPENPLAREFSDISGRISQILSESCDEVHLCVAGILMKLK